MKVTDKSIIEVCVAYTIHVFTSKAYRTYTKHFLFKYCSGLCEFLFVFDHKIFTKAPGAIGNISRLVLLILYLLCNIVSIGTITCTQVHFPAMSKICLLYTSDAADE